jgi:hypothetical protein
MTTTAVLRLSAVCCAVGGAGVVTVTLRHAALPVGCVGLDCETGSLRGSAPGEEALGILSVMLLVVAAVGLVANEQTSLVLLFVPFGVMCVVAGAYLLKHAGATASRVASAPA